jgi:hypothetical protein
MGAQLGYGFTRRIDGQYLQQHLVLLLPQRRHVRVHVCRYHKKRTR